MLTFEPMSPTAVQVPPDTQETPDRVSPVFGWPGVCAVQVVPSQE
jgi:hypothetical protein